MAEKIKKILGVNDYKYFQREYVYTREILFEKYNCKKAEETARQNAHLNRPVQERILRNNDMFRPIPIAHEPMLKNRFILEFPSEFEIESYYVQAAQKPKMFKYKWEPIEVRFIDVIGNSMTEKLATLVNICIDRRNKNEEFVFDFVMKMLDPVGFELEKWTIRVQDVLAVDFGDLDYGKDELSIVSMIVQPKDCIYK